MDVLKESIWSVDVERSIAGLRQAADLLASVGVPADAEISAEVGGRWLHVEARFLYDDEDEAGAEAPDPAAPLEAS